MVHGLHMDCGGFVGGLGDRQQGINEAELIAPYNLMLPGPVLPCVLGDLQNEA